MSRVFWCGLSCLVLYNLHYFISIECLISFIVEKKNQPKNGNLHIPIFSMLNLAKTISCGNKWPYVQIALYIRYFTCQREVHFPNLPVSATGCGMFKSQHARLHLSQLLSHFLSLADAPQCLQHSTDLALDNMLCFQFNSLLCFHTSVNDEGVLV